LGKEESTSESSGEAKKKKKKKEIIETTPAPAPKATGRPDDPKPAAPTPKRDPYAVRGKVGQGRKPVSTAPARSFRVESSEGDAKTGASRGAPTNLRAEQDAIRAPGQRNRNKVAEERRGRPKEPGGNADRSPEKTAPQAAFDSIQELRGRLDNTVPGLLGGMSRLNLNNQIKQLQEGGTPVMSGTMTVGVVSKGGTYSGRSEYSDFAMSSFRKNRKTGMPPILRTPLPGTRGTGSGGGGDGDRRDTSPEPDVTPKKPRQDLRDTGLMGSDDVAARARRAQISGGAGSAARRQFLKGLRR
tara:strand:+ start:887 stop:1786 length:900 start_codon:yes stop_codon:yes gene_type:complete